MVKALLVAGANPNWVNVQQKRPLDVARNFESIRLLLVFGANPSSIYEACRRHLPISCPTTPEEPSVKVFIVGDSGAGKSTLTESLKKDISGSLPVLVAQLWDGMRRHSLRKATRQGAFHGTGATATFSSHD